MKNNGWIEMAGWPGVGKTTLVQKEAPSLCSKGYTLIESRKPTFVTRVAAKFFYIFWLKPLLTDQRLAAALAYRLSFRMFLPRQKKVLFYDSGIVQLIFEYLIEHGPHKAAQILGMLPRLSLPSTLIYIEDGLDAVVMRELGRTPRRFAGIPVDSLRERYLQAEQVLKEQVFPFIPIVHRINVNDIAAFRKAFAE